MLFTSHCALVHVCWLAVLVLSIDTMYYCFSNRQSNYAMTLLAYKDARVGFPTVQKLLEKTCIQQKVKLLKVSSRF